MNNGVHATRGGEEKRISTISGGHQTRKCNDQLRRPGKKKRDEWRKRHGYMHYDRWEETRHVEEG